MYSFFLSWGRQTQKQKWSIEILKIFWFESVRFGNGLQSFKKKINLAKLALVVHKIVEIIKNLRIQK